MFDGPNSLERKFQNSQQSISQQDVFEYPRTQAEYEQLKKAAMEDILKAAPRYMRHMIDSCAW